MIENLERGMTLFHENHYSKLKTDSQFINIFKYD